MTRSIIILSAVLILTAGCPKQREDVERDSGIPVRVEIARRGDFSAALPLLGVVRAAETIPLLAMRGGIIHFAPRFAGGLKTGEQIARGALMATIVNEQSRFTLAQSKLALDNATAELVRMQRSFDLGIVSGAELDGAKARASLARETFFSARRESSTMSLVAPRAGTLIVKHRYAEGESIASGTVLAEVSSAAEPVVECSVSSSDRERLRPGMPVQITIPGDARWTAQGSIREVSSVLDEAGTATAIVGISNASSPAAPGTGVEVSVDLGKRTDVLSVPETSLAGGGNEQGIFVITGRGTFESATRVKKVIIDPGGRANGRVEIRNGLHEGDHVVVAGVSALSDGAAVFEVKEEKPGGKG